MPTCTATDMSAGSTSRSQSIREERSIAYMPSPSTRVGRLCAIRSRTRGFSDRYYASFVEDDSGIRIEFMHNPHSEATAG